MKILELTKLKRLYKLTLDKEVTLENVNDGNSTNSIYITEDTIVKFMLSKGKEINESELAEITVYSNFSRGKNAAIYFISFKSRTAHEVEKHLIEKEIPFSDIPKIIKDLQDNGLINDSLYAEHAIENAVLNGTKGPYSIKQKLLQRGISEDVINEKMNTIFPDEIQIEIAAKLAQKKAESIGGRTPAKLLKQKLQQNLVSKGFSFSIVDSALSEIDFEKDEENENDLLAREAERQYNRLSRRYDSYDLKQRLSQALARKGFDWSDISDELSNYDF